MLPGGHAGKHSPTTTPATPAKTPPLCIRGLCLPHLFPRGRSRAPRYTSSCFSTSFRGAETGPAANPCSVLAPSGPRDLPTLMSDSSGSAARSRSIGSQSSKFISRRWRVQPREEFLDIRVRIKMWQYVGTMSLCVAHGERGKISGGRLTVLASAGFLWSQHRSC